MKIDLKSIDIKELAGLVSETLKKHGIDAVLVGGSCVSIYTKNKYLSYDLDYVTHAEFRKIKPVLKELGFEQKSTRHFENEKCRFFIEFVNPPVALGKEVPVTKFNEIETRRGTVKMLSPTDCVKDRLAAFFHWKDQQSLDQAVMVAKDQKVDLKNVKKWAEGEGKVEKFNLFQSKLKES